MVLSSTETTEEQMDWGSFTLQHDKRIDQRVSSDLQVVVEEVLKILGDRTLAIILGGGFGRGEGAVLVEDSGIDLVSDYDLMVISKPMSRRQRIEYARRLDLVGRELATRLQLPLRVEIGLADENALRRSANLIINYELKNGHKVLWGREDILDLMPPYSAAELPLEEAAILLWNRGGELLRAARLIWQGKALTREQLKLVVFYYVKVNLALGDSLLLLEGRYHHLYSERRERIQALPQIRTKSCGLDIRPGYLEASRFKLEPTLKPFADRDLKKWWFELRDTYLRYYFWFENERRNEKFADWQDYLELLENSYSSSLVPVLRNYRRNIRTFGILAPWKPGKLKLYCIRQELLLRSILLSLLPAKTEGGIEAHYLRRATHLLGNGEGTQPEEQWLSLVSRYISCWHE